MSFGSNVVFYRKRSGITQEALAEKMEVTWQTVSRWETDSAFPDMEKLIALCDLFGCDMETLVRGNAEGQCSDERKESLSRYNKHMNIFTALITSGVALILAGVTGLLFICAFGGSEMAGVILLLGCVAVAVGAFIVGGCLHDNFTKENPHICKYPKERIRAFRAKQPFLFSGATVLILLGVIAVVAMTYKEGYFPSSFADAESWEYFSAAILMCTVTIAVGIYVGTGMLMEKYDVKGYNRENGKRSSAAEGRSGTGGKESRAKKGKRIADSVSGSIMMLATAVFLLIGFVWGQWHPGWVVFPVGGILCGIVSGITEAVYGKSDSEDSDEDSEEGTEAGSEEGTEAGSEEDDSEKQ